MCTSKATWPFRSTPNSQPGSKPVSDTVFQTLTTAWFAPGSATCTSPALTQQQQQMPTNCPYCPCCQHCSSKYWQGRRDNCGCHEHCHDCSWQESILAGTRGRWQILPSNCQGMATCCTAGVSTSLAVAAWQEQEVHTTTQAGTAMVPRLPSNALPAPGLINQQELIQ